MRYAKSLLTAVNKILSKKFGLGELVVLGIIAVSTISYTLAWQAPGSNPPSGNTDAPLNVGATAQYKSGGLLLNTGGAANGLIVQNGNVGIGTTNPAVKVEINSPADTPQLKLINTGAGGIGWYIYSQQGGNFHIWDDGAPITRLFIQKGTGNVGIGKTNPAGKLDVNGSICFNGDCRSGWNNGIAGYEIITASGNDYNAPPITVYCSAGKRTISGGCDASRSLRQSYPIGESGWSCASDAGANITAYVICADITL